MFFCISKSYFSILTWFHPCTTNHSLSYPQATVILTRTERKDTSDMNFKIVNCKSCTNPDATDPLTYMNTYQRKYSSMLLTRLPNIWLIAALSFKVHSATTFALISFMYSMNAFKGFFIWGFFLSVKHHRRVWEVVSTVWKSTVNWSQKPRSVKWALTLIVLLPCILCFRVVCR